MASTLASPCFGREPKARVATKALNKGYNFSLNLTSIEDLKKMLWAGLQSRGSPNFGNFGTPNLGVLGKNEIWVQAPWLGINNTIRGKVVASRKSRSW